MTTQAAPAPLLSFYSQRIMALLSITAREAVLVEAWMRCERPSLDALDATTFKAEAVESLACVRQSEDSQNVRLAKSFGMAVPS